MEDSIPNSHCSGDANSNTKTSDGAHAVQPRHKKWSTLGTIFGTLLLEILAWTMILPLTPQILQHYGQHDKDGLYGWLVSVVASFCDWIGTPDTAKWNAVLLGGLLGSLFSFLQFLASPFMGAVSDVYGRKPVLIVSLLGIASSYGIWAGSTCFAMFVFSRIVCGISKGNVSLSIAIVADIYPKEDRGKGMAAIGIAFSLGFLLGPMLGAYISVQLRDEVASNGMDFTYPALVAFALAVSSLILVVVFFKESLPLDKRASGLGSGLNNAVNYVSPSSLFQFKSIQGCPKEGDLHSMRTIGLVYFLYLFIFSGLEYSLTFLTYKRFHYDSMSQGKMFLFMGLIMITIQGGYVRRLKAGQELKYAKRGLISLSLAFILIAFGYHPVVFYVGLALFSFASATIVPCLTSLISEYGGADQKGTVLGTFRSLGALARAVGPVTFCTLYWSSGAMVCYLVGAVSLVIPAYYLRKVKIAHKDE